MTWSGSYANFGCRGAGNWPGREHPPGKHHYREMLIDRLRFSSPLAMRQACRASLGVYDGRYRRRHMKPLADGSVYFYLRNAAKIDYYRDLAERWLRKRKFGVGLHVLNLRSPVTEFIHGDLSECLAYAAAWIDKNSNYAFRREVSVDTSQLNRLRPQCYKFRWDEYYNKFPPDPTAMLASNLLFVYEANSFGEDTLDVIGGLMRTAGEHSKFCYEEITSLVEQKSVAKLKLPADYC